MKKFLRTLAVVLALTALLSVCAFAQGGEKLLAFEDVASMSSYTFSDVVSSEWYYSDLKTAYDKGIISGTPEGTFLPNQTTTWSHTITVAAQIHAIYHDNTIDAQKAGELWYLRFYNYCVKYNLLPTGCPSVAAMNTATISRYDLAYIFSRVIDDEDLPAINENVVKDASSLPDYYKSSVLKLNRAGIVVGCGDYCYHGNNKTTRAELAALVARTIVPVLRADYDAQANNDMAEFEANLENDSIMVQIGSNHYCIYKYYDTPNDLRYGLYLVESENDNTQLYACPVGSRIENLQLNNGKIYFSECVNGTAEGSILCYDPAAGSISTVYSGYGVESFCFYNNKIYALFLTGCAQNAESMSSETYEFASISGGSIDNIIGDFYYPEVQYFQPYGWNDRLYFKLTDENGVTTLYTCALDGTDFYQLSDFNINASFYDGHNFYFLAYDEDGNYDLNLYAFSLELPAAVKVYGEFPGTTSSQYRSLYMHDDTFYCLSSFNKHVYSMDKSGNARMVLNCNGVYSAMCFTDDMVAIIPNQLSVDNANELRIFRTRSLSGRNSYADWMGLSCYYKGARFAPYEGQAVYTSNGKSVSTIEKLDITVPEAFMQGTDFVVRAHYVNNFENTIKLRMYSVRVFDGSTLVASSVNSMVSMEMDQYDVQTFTFVIGANDIRQSFDPSSPNLTIEISPYSEVVVDTEESTGNDQSISADDITEVITDVTGGSESGTDAGKIVSDVAGEISKAS